MMTYTSALEKIRFPTTRDEDWRYTNLKPLAETPFDVAAVAVEFERPPARPGLTVCRLSVAWQGDGELLQAIGGEADDAFPLLNRALSPDGAFIRLDKDTEVADLIHIMYRADDGDGRITNPRNVIFVGENSRAIVLETYLSRPGSGGSGRHFTNAVTEIRLAAGARLLHVKVTVEGGSTYHVGNTRVLQERGSRFDSFSFSTGTKLARHDINVSQEGEGCETHLNGFYALKDDQHCDHHTRIDHKKPHGTSRQLYKGILEGRARGVFNGKIHVHRAAQHCDSAQLNKNLLLSRDARIDTKPELLIDADDVKCKHGATVGQLSDEEIFYCQSRAIPREMATRMLIHGFAEDVIDQIDSATVREKLVQLLEARFFESVIPSAVEGSSS